jgi:glycosyltransferase involved in cell wall biosynthesis
MTQPVSDQRPVETLFHQRNEGSVRAPSSPRVAVVLASRSDTAFLRPALPGLVVQCAQLHADLVLVRPGAGYELAYLEAEFPTLRIVGTGADSDLEEMRARGLAEASCDITVLLDDRLPPSTWERRLAGVRSKLEATSVTPAPPPLFSVVVPAHQAGDGLLRTLGALNESDLPRGEWELIVVDDASSDGTASAAARFADILVRLPGGQPFGPAYARNRGADLARGEIIVFIDADVRVRPDTLSRFRSAFIEAPDASAVIGCYDCSPAGRGVVSQYRNLLHHYVHQKNAGSTDAFWGGCGAVRRLAFLEAGGYDEWTFDRPQVEDIELGHRLTSAGRTIVLRPEIQATHLKRWTLRNLIATDIWDQGVPWVRVVSQRVAKPATAVIGPRTMERLNAILAWVGAGAALVSAATRDARWLWAVAICLVAIIVNNRGQLAFFVRARGVAFTAVSIALDSLCYLISGVAAIAGWLLREIIGEPRPDPVTQAYYEVGAKQWPPVRTKRAVPKPPALAGPAANA